MQEYEYLDDGGHDICRLHDRLRCDECFYVSELQQQNKRYREAIDSMRLHAYFPEIIKQIYEALEESE